MRIQDIIRWHLVLLCCTTSTVVCKTNLSSSSTTALRVMSYNVRYDSMPDNITVQETIASLDRAIPPPPSQYYANTSEKPWSTRRLHVANDILLRNVDVYGGQELLHRQVLDVEELLGDDFAWIGVGRDDGRQSGEYAAIFYNKQKIELRDWDTFWLTDTPFDVSKYPGAGSYRVATTAHFVCNDGPFTMINTHLDDQSADQRRLGASLILRRAKYEAIKTRRPVVVTGDFNSPSDDGAYLVATGVQQPDMLNKTFTDRYSWTADEERGFEDFVLEDLLGETPPQRRSGNYATFTGFVAVNDYTSFQRIDYVFGGSNKGWTARSYHVGTNLYDDGIYASDHRPVIADLDIGSQASLTRQR